MWKPRRGIPVLMYHSVSEERESAAPAYYRLVTSPRRFREQMLWLREHGYKAIDLAAAVAVARGNIVAEPRVVVISFDDGYRDFLENAWPVLQECGFNASVFLPTASVERRFCGRGCLSWREVRELSRASVKFGSHTVNHPTLRGLPWVEIRRELRDSRCHLEDALGLPVTRFSYPYAFPQEDCPFVEQLGDELLGCGYEVGVTTVIGRFKSDDDERFIKRLPVNECDDVQLLECKLRGAYDWVGVVQKFSRLSRRTRERLLRGTGASAAAGPGRAH